MSGKAFFMLRGVDSALWTAARQQAKAEGETITDLVERLLVCYMNSAEYLYEPPMAAISRCIRCNTDYSAVSRCACGANSSLKDNRTQPKRAWTAKG